MSLPAQRNIGDIPDEHLAEIFRLAIGDTRYRGKTRTIIQLVCRRWRRTMLDSKFLWSKITVEVEDLSTWIDPHYYERGPPDASDLDLRYIAQCLRVAHGHPLDITLRIARMPEYYCIDRWDAINEALQLLRSHSIRIRSLFCSAPSWFFEVRDIHFNDEKDIHFNTLLNLNYLPRLETLSLSVEPDESIPAHILQRLVADKVGLSRSLRHLSINFPFRHFDVAWSHITSFAGGFDDHTHFLDVLPRMIALESLHLMYILPLGAADPERCITLEALLHLKLSNCSAVAMSLMKDKLRLPGVKELSLLPTKPHLHRSTEACPVKGLNADIADSLCSIFERSGASIGTLNVSVDPSTHSDILRRLYEKLGSTVQSLQLVFDWRINGIEDIAATFGMLNPAGHRSLLPRMTELEVIGRSANQQFIFEGPALEELIESRWEEGKRSSSCARLRKLRLRRTRSVEDSDAHRDYSLAGSSLALTLWKYRAAGLDVYWMDEHLYEAYLAPVPGDVDVLNDTQEYIPQWARTHTRVKNVSTST